MLNLHNGSVTEKVTANSWTNEEKYFKNAVDFALHHKKISSHPIIVNIWR